MKILVTGKGGAVGSWQIRGVQLGKALGATVQARATLDDIKAHDVTILVKRAPSDTLQALQQAGKPWLYDIVDAYPQPECGVWSREQAINWLKAHIKMLKPTAVVWPNARMRFDMGHSRSERAVYHHHRVDIERNPIRERIKRIGYEGSPQYIEAWRPAIARECARRGMEFVLNPDRLADIDVVLALRGGLYDGYAQRNWKSNVKLANAHGSGTPFIGARESGYEETASRAEYWADTALELGRALDWLDSRATRQTVRDEFLKHAIPVEMAAAQMREALNAL